VRMMVASRKQQIVRVILFNLGLIAIATVVLEAAFGHWRQPNSIHRLNLVRDCVKRYDASILYPVPGVVTYTRDEWGFRGAYPSLDDIDIVTLGGSATDQRYITDGATWQDVIAREFAAAGKTVSVVNAGVDGQSTYGHLKDFDWWFPTVPGLKVRYVLFYIGGNDIYKDIDSDFDDLVNDRPPTWKTYIRERSAVFNAAHTANGIYQARHVHRLSHRRTDFAAWKWTRKPLASNHEALVASRIERYRKAVAMLARDTVAIGAVPIFVSQSLSVYRRRPDGRMEGRVDAEPYDQEPINGMDLYLMMRVFGRATMEECSKAGGICIDAGNEIDWQPGDFYDAIHNTPQGAERLGKYLYSKLAELPLGE